MILARHTSRHVTVWAALKAVDSVVDSAQFIIGPEHKLHSIVVIGRVSGKRKHAINKISINVILLSKAQCNKSKAYQNTSYHKPIM